MARVSGARRQGCPPGSLAWRQYEVELASGRTATFAFSLADPDHQAMARMKRKYKASHFGLLVVLDDPGSTEEVVLWFHRAASLTLMSHTGDEIIGDEVQALLPHYFAVFFDEIRDLAPGLADIVLPHVPPGTGEKHLH